MTTRIMQLAVVLAVLITPSIAEGAAPRAVAHRGSHVDCPWTENTFRAFRRCAVAADMIEVDMRLSSDGQPVFIHDATLDRTTLASGPVAARTFKQLRAVTTADGVGRIPSVATIAKHISDTGQWVAVDVKVWPHAKGWRILRRHLGVHRDRVIFFSAKKNRYVKAAKSNGFKAAHFTWSSQPAPTVAQVRGYGRFVWRVGSLTDARARRFRNAGIRVIRDDDRARRWERFAVQGAWAINTDRLPDYLEWRSGP